MEKYIPLKYLNYTYQNLLLWENPPVNLINWIESNIDKH